MKSLHSILLFIVCFFIVSCNKSGSDQQTLLQERDSLLSANRDLTEVMEFVAVTMDSIQVQENVLFVMDRENTGVHDNKATVIQKLNHFSELLKSRREYIDSVSKVLASQGAETKHLRHLLKVVNEQLRIKDQEIASLKSDLENSKKNVAELTAFNTKLKTDVKDLQEQTSIQEEALAAQDKIINECYVKIGTSKELQQEEILVKGGLFKKKKSDFSKIRKETFRAVDIREFTELKITGKKARILTPAPKGSYELTKNEGGYLLRIKNPTLFWSVSNFLIIQND